MDKHIYVIHKCWVKENIIAMLLIFLNKNTPRGIKDILLFLDSKVKYPKILTYLAIQDNVRLD